MKFGRFDTGAIGAQNGVLAAALLMLVAAIVFGGGTRQGLPSDAFLQLLAVPVLAGPCASAGSEIAVSMATVRQESRNIGEVSAVSGMIAGPGEDAD